MEKLYALIKANGGSLTSLTAILDHIDSIYIQFESNLTADKGNMRNALIDSLIEFLQSEKTS